MRSEFFAARKTLAIIGAGLTLVLAVGIGAHAAAQPDAPADAASTTTRSNAEENVDYATLAAKASLLPCVVRWNNGDSTGPKTVALLALSGGAGRASVGYSEEDPDRCLITVAFFSSDQSVQFLENPKGSPLGSFSPVASGLASHLPESVTDWNASVVSGTGGLRPD